MNCIHRLFLLLLLALCVVPANAAERAIIVLDGSGSMWGQIDGKPKLEIARESLDQVLASMPPGVELGLIAYGHRRKGDCSDIELMVPPAAGTASAIAAATANMSFLGKTPLSAAVRQAAEALRYTEDKATVILITDGLETCNADPCALGRELEQAGVDFTAHVVGFGLSQDEGKKVSCLAEATGGRYFQADNAGTLGAALSQTVAIVATPVPPPAPEPAAPAKPTKSLIAGASLAEGGPPLDDKNIRWEIRPLNADGSVGKVTKAAYVGSFEQALSEGDYQLYTRLDQAETSQNIHITDGEVLNVPVVLHAVRLALSARRSEEATSDEKDARIDVRYPGGTTGAYGSHVFVVPAGTQNVHVRIGKSEADFEFELAAGEAIERSLVVGTGQLNASAVYAEGGPAAEGNDLRLDVYQAAVDIKGKHAYVDGGYGSRRFELAPGDYLLYGRVGKAQTELPFSVRAGEQQDLVININGGVLVITAPGARRIDVYSAQVDIQGKQQRWDGGYGEQFQTTLPPGDYRIVAEGNDQKTTVEGQATVRAGQRSEVRVE